MNYPLTAPVFAIGLFIGMFLFVELGRRIGIRRRLAGLKREEGVSSTEGAVFALFGLLLAFTFSGATSRFDERRHLIVDEANAIGTAWNMLDLLPAQDRPALRDSFKKYLDARLLTYKKLPDVAAAKKELAVSLVIQQSIWDRCAVICEAKYDPSMKTLVMESVNEMMNVTTTRTAVMRFHPPWEIFALLFGLGLGCSFLAGNAMAVAKKRSLTHIILFAAVISLSVYVILDLEYPRFGLIQVSGADQVLIELRESMESKTP